MEWLLLVNKLIALATVAAHLFVVSSIIYLLWFKKKYPGLLAFFGKHGMLFAFSTSLLAAVGSLFYSQIAGFPPCDLCWYQRIFMYPLVVLLALALVKKDRAILDYALLLSLMGALISLYHNYLYYDVGGLSAICQFLGIGTSCVKRYVFELNYITIPLMAFTAFVLITLFLVFSKMQQKQDKAL